MELPSLTFFDYCFTYILYGNPEMDQKNCLTLFFSIPGQMNNTLLVEFGQNLKLAKGVTLAAHPGQTPKERLTILKPQLVTINMNMIGGQKL